MPGRSFLFRAPMEKAGENLTTDAEQTTEAMEQFLEEATPKILVGLKELHRERYPEKYR